jgi:hypothetical protein
VEEWEEKRGKRKGKGKNGNSRTGKERNEEAHHFIALLIQFSICYSKECGKSDQ